MPATTMGGMTPFQRTVQEIRSPSRCADRDHPKYSPASYWRSPVWMDQAMFAVEAMHNYGRDEEAVASAYRLFDHAKGLLGGESINENYNPKTGDRLNATNFGWSSAAFYKRDCRCFFSSPVEGVHPLGQCFF